MRARKAVIPAAGLGTRFLPATKAVPKELLPIVDTPTIQFIVGEAVAAGMEDVILINGRGKGAIEDHFDIAYELEDTLRRRAKDEMADEVRRVATMARLLSVRQKEPLGLGHAVLCAENAVGNEPFAVLLGDDLIFDADPQAEPTIGTMARLAEEHDAGVVALMPVPDDQCSRYGIAQVTPLDDRLVRIEDLVEKPPAGTAPSNQAVIGRYVLPPDIFPILARTRPGAGGEIQLTDGLRILAEQGRLLGYVFPGTRYDAGDRLGYLQASIAHALTRATLRDDLLAWLKDLLGQEGAR